MKCVTEIKLSLPPQSDQLLVTGKLSPASLQLYFFSLHTQPQCYSGLHTWSQVEPIKRKDDLESDTKYRHVHSGFCDLMGTIKVL